MCAAWILLLNQTNLTRLSRQQTINYPLKLYPHVTYREVISVAC